MIKIKKINATTIKVGDTRLSLNDTSKIVKNAGTNYYVQKNKQDGSYIISELKKMKMYKLVGGFHYGLIPEDFKAINNISKSKAKKIRGINAYSIWDKEHRPVCNPEGMVYIPKLNIWVDIYLTNSEHEKFGTSVANKNIMAGGESYGRKCPQGKTELRGSDIDAISSLHKKRFLSKNEFQIAMDGVKENDSANDSDDGTTKHIKDFTSKYGIEQATGVQWVWSSTKYSESTEDDERFILGANRDGGVRASSRASDWSGYVWYSLWYIGSRFACDHLKLV